MSNNFVVPVGFEPTSSHFKRVVHKNHSATRPYLCPRWDSNPQSRTLKGWCFTNSATRAFQKPIRGLNLLPITHRLLFCQPSYIGEPTTIAFVYSVSVSCCKNTVLFFIFNFCGAFPLERGFLPFHIRSEIHPLRVCYVLVPFIEVLVELLVYVVPELIPKVLFQ